MTTTFITGGNKSLGYEAARRLRDHGHRVVIGARDANRGRQAAEDLGVNWVLIDVTSDESVASAAAEVRDRFGGLDVLINNAGISGPTTSVENLDPDEWDAVLAVNLTGPFNVTRLAIPHLKKSDAGVVIMMSSVGGRFGYANRSTYATTKRALIALAETLALELGDHGIRVNTIAPGAVAGPRMDGVLKARAAATGRDPNDVLTDALGIQSIKRFADPRDVAALALFLAGEHASTITGQTFAIDGGAKAPQ